VRRFSSPCRRTQTLRREVAPVSLKERAPRPRVQLWVKAGKAQCEQMFSAVALIADIAQRSQHVRFVPTPDLPHISGIVPDAATTHLCHSFLTALARIRVSRAMAEVAWLRRSAFHKKQIGRLSNHFPLNSCLSARPKHNHSSDDRLIQYAGQCSRHYPEAFDATGLMIDKPDNIAPRSTHPLRLM
jgi:hypothetical protein